MTALANELLTDAARRIRDGALVAYPTETVWGLGADARSEDALAALRRFKGRSENAPIAILIGGLEELECFGFVPTEAVRTLAERFWPGPLTLVLPCKGRFARGVARQDGAVGVRCSPHPVAAALAGRVAQLGAGPLTATSLNESGHPPAATLREAQVLCHKRGEAGGAVGDAPLVVDGGTDAGGAPPSTVLDLTGEEALVLRWGALSESSLVPVLQEIRIS